MFRFTKYKPSVLKTLEQTCSETHFRIKASNLSQTIFKDLSVLADRKKFFPPMLYSDSNYLLFSGKPAISKIRFDFLLFPGFPLVPGDRKFFPLSGPFRTVDKPAASPRHLSKKAENGKARELREIQRTLYLNSQHLKKANRQRLLLLLSFIDRFINPNPRFRSTIYIVFFFANFKISFDR